MPEPVSRRDWVKSWVEPAHWDEVEEKPVNEVAIEVYRARGGALQVHIVDQGDGYRIAGPKFDGTSELLLRHVLSERDAKEIRSHIDRLHSHEPGVWCADCEGQEPF